MTPDLDAGLLWVENRIRELSRELDRPVYCMEWLRQFGSRTKKTPL